MKGIINNIIDFYQMQEEALNVLLNSTQKALEQSEKKRKADEQAQRVENFVRDLTMDLNNMLTKFYFLKDRKNRKQEQLTEGQKKAAVEFAAFVKTLINNVSSLLKRFEGSQAFEEKIDKEIKELEASVRQKLREFDKALDEAGDTSTVRLIKFVRNIIISFTRLIRLQMIFLTQASSKEAGKPLGELMQNTSEDSPAQIRDSGNNQLENLFSCSSVKPVESSDKKSKCLMDIRA
jgi:hypothetical protein